ncbi:MAG: phosphoribosyl-ATP diphosphatase [Rhizobiaceae bacterium]|nr:phosphoribosyl-ATP diphosphatase [Rhizobiaceae bacterium]
MFTLKDLEKIIASRAGETAAKSYTASLLAKGTHKCAEKFGEEAIEAIVAAATGNRDELTREAADVLFHLLVLLKSENIALSEVLDELERRTDRSGHEEKASR